MRQGNWCGTNSPICSYPMYYPILCTYDCVRTINGWITCGCRVMWCENLLYQLNINSLKYSDYIQNSETTPTYTEQHREKVYNCCGVSLFFHFNIFSHLPHFTIHPLQWHVFSPIVFSIFAFSHLIVLYYFYCNYLFEYSVHKCNVVRADIIATIVAVCQRRQRSHRCRYLCTYPLAAKHVVGGVAVL